MIDVGVGVALDQVADSTRATVGVVGVLDARRGADELADRPVRDPGAVRQAAALEEGRLVPDRGAELRDEAALADAGRADARSRGARTVRRRVAVRVASRARSASRPTSGMSCRRRATGSAPGWTDTSRNAGTGSRLALGGDRLDRLDLDGVPDQHPRPAPMQDLARRRGLLEPRGGVDRVAGDEGLAGRPGRRRPPRPCAHPCGSGSRCPRLAVSSALRAASSSRIWAAARTARSASSSCTTAGCRTRPSPRRR